MIGNVWDCREVFLGQIHRKIIATVYERSRESAVVSQTKNDQQVFQTYIFSLGSTLINQGSGMSYKALLHYVNCKVKVLELRKCLELT